jgi:hypothetical protein
MADVNALNDELDKMILSGKMMEAFEKFYAEDCSMQENMEAPTVGKGPNRDREQQFLANVEAFHGARLLGSAARGDRSFSEWELEMTVKGMGRNKLTQVAVRQWKNGQIIHERFYYKA